MPFIAIAIAIAAALGGGASLAAQGSVPGDALYPVKVSINESVHGALSFGEKAKAHFDVDVVQARMQEAAKLSASGKLGSTTRAHLEANIAAHVQSVEARVAKLQARGDYAAAAEVAAKFEATVAKHASALGNASAHANIEAQAALAPILTKVRATLNAASNLSSNAQAQAEAHGDTSVSNSGSANTGTGATSSQGHSGSGKAQGNAGVNVNAGAGTQGSSGSASGTVNIDL